MEPINNIHDDGRAAQGNLFDSAPPPGVPKPPILPDPAPPAPPQTNCAPRRFSLSVSTVDRNITRIKEGDHTEAFPRRVDFDGVDLAKLADAVCMDHAAPSFAQNYRKDDNFNKTNCTIGDVDNSESDDPGAWVTIEKAVGLFTRAGVEFYIIPSKSHQKEKGGKAARDRFHILFPHRLIERRREYALFKIGLLTVCPFFDKQTKDISRFFFGTPGIDSTQIKYRPGAKDIIDYVSEGVGAPIGETPAAPPKQAQKREVTSTPTNTPPEASDATSDVKNAIEREASGAPSDRITEGSRNSVLSATAFDLLIRWGDKDGKARARYDDTAKTCAPPLPQKEVDGIWRAAVKAYHNKVKNEPGYIDPKVFEPNNTAQAEAGSGEGAVGMIENDVGRDENVDGSAETVGRGKAQKRRQVLFHHEEYGWICNIIKDEAEQNSMLRLVIDYRINIEEYLTGAKTPPPMGERAETLFGLCKINADRDYKNYIAACKANARNGAKGRYQKARNREKLAEGNDR